MRVKETGKNRIFLWLSAGVILITAICVCFSSCRLVGNTGEKEQEAPSIQLDAYDAKIVYYEAQLQSLTTQLGSMEQQLYMMKEEYLSQLQALEEKLSATSKPEDVPSLGQPLEPSEKEENEEPTQDVVSPGEEVVLCEYTYRLENGFAILTSYRGNEREVIIPAAVDGYLVVGLGDRMFADCNVLSVTLPQTVERLGWFTFYGCKNLQKVVLPSGVKNIGYASFDGCPPGLCLYVSSGSFAEQFAISFGLKYQIT
jgi:hypothetical protein